MVSGGAAGVVVEIYGERARSRVPLVSWARQGADAAVVVGRLYYTEVLEARTSVSPAAPVPVSAGRSDAELVLCCYQREGPSGLEKLEGDFAVVVWDGRRRLFVARRDPFGAYPLFWTRVGGTTAFATGLAPLAGLLPVRSLDPGQLAEGLLAASSDRERNEACVYTGISRVLADTIVTVDPDRGSVGRHRYWSWRERAVDPATDRISDLAPRYRELLTEAVRQRMSGSSAAELSGGMDSTSVCLLALGLIRAGAAQGPLHAFSLVYETLPDLAKEQRYVDAAVAGASAQLIHHRLPGDDLLDFDGFTDPPPHDEPTPWIESASGRAELSLAARLGVRSLLTGIGADDLLDIRPYHLSDLLRAGHGLTAWRDACGWAEAHRGNAFRVLRRYGFAGLPRNAWPGVGVWGRHRRTDTEEAAWRRVPPWIRPEFARRYCLAERLAGQDRQAHRGEASTAISLGVHALERRVGRDYRWRLAAPLGIAVTHPFLDPRVASFALGALHRLRPEPTRFKPLLADAMMDVLPDAIRLRSDKRPFNEVFYLGLRRNLPALLALLNTPALTELGMIDTHVVIDALEDAAMGVTSPWSSSSVTHVPALAAWLAHYEQWHRQPTPTMRMELEVAPHADSDRYR